MYEEERKSASIDHNLFNSAHSRGNRGKMLLRILCVDDSTYNLFVLTELLSTIDERGCLEVETALNGSIAFEKVKGSPHYDIILMDLHMPIKDGY